jgi:hypothetical protein
VLRGHLGHPTRAYLGRSLGRRGDRHGAADGGAGVAGGDVGPAPGVGCGRRGDREEVGVGDGGGGGERKGRFWCRGKFQGLMRGKNGGETDGGDEGINGRDIMGAMRGRVWTWTGRTNSNSDKTPRPKPVYFACFASLISNSPLNQIKIKYST